MKHSRTFMALTLALLATTATAAETCYQDDTGRIVKRRRPGYTEVPCPDENAQPGETPSAAPDVQPQEDTGRAPRRRVIERALPAYVSPIPRPGLADYVDSVPVPDRWRIVDTLGYKERWFDPYNRNVLKADRPVHGDDWFFNLGVISDTVYELREVPTPVGGISTDRPGGVDVFGSADQWAAVENLAAEFVYYKGDTVFKPPDYEFRFTPVFSYNYVELETLQGVNADAREGKTRNDHHLGIQAAFIDKHLLYGDRKSVV